MASEVYKFKDGSMLKCRDPEVVVDELTRIREKRGRLTARDVWQESRRKDRPLHNEFEWDDRAAADLYRDQAARRVIQSIIVVRADDSAETRAFIHVDVREVGESYERVEVVMADSDLCEQAITEALRYLRTAEAKLRSIQQFIKLADQLSLFASQIEKERAA